MYMNTPETLSSARACYHTSVQLARNVYLYGFHRRVPYDLLEMK